MAKTLLKILAVFIIGMVGGIFAKEIFWPYFVERPLFYQYDLDRPPLYVTERKEIIIQEPEALTKAIEKAEGAVLGVRTVFTSGKTIEGSGLILSSDGLAVTLASLVPRAGDFSFYVKGKPVAFQILKRDPKKDLALVKLEGENFSTVSFEENFKLGERVFLLGIVFGQKGTPQKIVNEGIIKSWSQEFIKTNIFESYLLAGSPLFDIEAKVLGLNFIDKQGKVIALPISKIRAFAGL